MDLRLTGPRLRGALRRRPRRTLAAAAAVVVLAGAGTWTATASDEAAPVKRSDRAMDTAEGVRIDTSYFTSGGDGRRPAVLLGHGFGGSKNDVRKQAETLARDGYAVLTWSARGFGDSTGKIGLNDPKGEVADVSKLIDWLAKRPEVQLDKKGDPRLGVAGASYGGAISLLAAGYDDRVDAIAPAITYWNLADALFPNGVFKKLWAGLFVNTGGGCEKFEKQLCEMYQRVAESGQPDAQAVKLLQERSPEAVGDRIKVPTLLMQGQTDSLFPLGQADAAARAIKANGAPVDVDWISGGHDGGDMETSRVQARTQAWFDRYLKGDKSADTGSAFRVTRTLGAGSGDGEPRLAGTTDDTYPGLEGDPTKIALAGREQSFESPAGANPPAISALPGLGAGGGLAQLSSLGVGISLDFPGQFAAFQSKPVADDLQITGSPTATVHVKSTSEDAVLFAKVYDVGPDGRSQVLPSQLVEPVRVRGAKAGKDVTLTLPAVDHELDDGHRLRLVLASTDLGYASPTTPATYTVSLKGGLEVPTPLAGADRTDVLPAWVWYLPIAGAVIAAVLLVTGRRRIVTPAPDPALAEVPLQITDLSKKYRNGDRYSVRDLSLRVEKGQVLGLLGPNGAGKTTTLRMLMGLIQPDGGQIRVFGHAIVPGAPVLSRVGAFVEGAGFLPHLSGRENLELYWAATGRPAEDAHLDEALEIAGLGDALARAVRTYSQGMRQRLAIAQAMLGLPDLLILDEPTNGLDPPQIREMREVMIRYAAAGRTVIVSSHLLAEVEQTCTHLVVMDHGQLVQAGPVSEIVGSGDTLLVGTSEPVDEPLVEKIAALPGVDSAVPADGGLVVRLDAGGSARRLVAELVRLDVPVESVGPHRRLEDAFLTLIGESA
ncbi:MULTISPECIES: alpha/beta fold hydrolase [Streptomyces]|uniref:ABC-2 type transport system ATP-binding protein n=1 Tax=Streptomyces stelliscabiei TaxID=146820 RepID=A0A8I0TR87_9ACTN|nr:MULTISPECIES: alpha/beta fold hydrolase [Streptomyces]KND45583.1 ABC transporter ATP-binding protein [Streptomyces stelliscabiei]MBE1597424.1 ABC-2 type transport system ATP-binding protein [Streptomyces stelliscabiei]MDX2513651.1 alpha/beta fold hydrolase [Streptomyces stelliscabiei]MDX2549924.1 alpha/beta fold hydrolase [Streptomyces stelliscabiei]MDX2610656.1 alpha/beta fold hydrolase [Streptomyces stelliscabiei]